MKNIVVVHNNISTGNEMIMSYDNMNDTMVLILHTKNRRILIIEASY